MSEEPSLLVRKVYCLLESFNSKKACFSWRWPVSTGSRILSPSPTFPRTASSLMWKRQEHSAEAGVQKGGGSFQVQWRSSISIVWWEERSLCPAWFRLCWRAHWRLCEEASFREEGEKSHGLVCLPSPHLLSRYHIYCRINKNYSVVSTRP